MLSCAATNKNKIAQTQLSSWVYEFLLKHFIFSTEINLIWFDLSSWSVWMPLKIHIPYQVILMLCNQLEATTIKSGKIFLTIMESNFTLKCLNPFILLNLSTKFPTCQFPTVTAQLCCSRVVSSILHCFSKWIFCRILPSVSFGLSFVWWFCCPSLFGYDRVYFGLWLTNFGSFVIPQKKTNYFI